MGKLSIEDLGKIKEAVSLAMNLREGIYRARVSVHMGDCGLAAGARAVVAAVMDEVAQRELKDVIVMTVGCPGLCSREPMVTVELPGCPPVQYGDVNADRMREIFREHVLGGKVVAPYAQPVGGDTTDSSGGE